MLLTVTVGAQGRIPNEGCSIENMSSLFRASDSGHEVQDAGVGATRTSTYGSVERTIQMPPARTGQMGLATLYGSLLEVDLSNPAWSGSGTTLKGGDIPVPNVSSSVLDSGTRLQPRPGTMPGLYIYQTTAGESLTESLGDSIFYHYGAPVNSGANPQTTAIYLPPSGELPSTVVFTTTLSGAQLWYYGGEDPPYIEVKHVDGTVARFDSFDPYSTPQSGTLWRTTSVTDPYDNVAAYTYSTGSHHLTSIEYPSGLKQSFDYTPTWKGGGNWNGTNYTCLEISYEQTSGSTPTALTDLTWGLVFDSSVAGSTGAHFGAWLHRIYSAPRTVLKDPATVGQPHTITTGSTVSGQVVHTLSYSSAMVTEVTETQAVHTGTAFAESLTTVTDLANRDLVNTVLSTSSGTQGRVVSQEQCQTGSTLTFSYPTTGLRTTDLLSGTVLAAIDVTDAISTVRRVEYDTITGRVYSRIHTPSNNLLGRPRETHKTTENASIGGVATTDVEPESITIYNIYDAGCICNKPIEVQEIARRNSTNYTRVTEFEYYVGTRLLKTRKQANPETGTSPPAQVTWSYEYVQALDTGHLWGAWLPSKETTPDGEWEYEYTNWLNRGDATNHGRIAGTVARKIKNVRLQTTLTGAVGSSGTAYITETLHRNLSNQPGSFSYQGNVNGMPRATYDGDGVLTTFGYSGEGWLSTLTEYGGASVTTYTHGASGNVTALTQNANATASASTSFTGLAPYGEILVATTSSGGLTRTSEYYYDRYGHVTVSRRNNLDSSSSAPTKHGGSSSTPRSWVESQFHYQHSRLKEKFVDRKPLDEAAGTGQFLKTEYEYHANGRLDSVVRPSGATVEYDFDGYGTLYRAVTKAPDSSGSVSSPKYFVNPFLEVTATYQPSGTDHLWTAVTRNAAGAITRIDEPSTTAPSGYTAATGGAAHVFEIDKMGRVIEARAYDDSSLTTLLREREVRFDQLDRQIWQHDVVLGAGSGDHYVAWKYVTGKGTQLDTITATGTGARTYAYLTSGFLDQITDAESNLVEYEYHADTPYLKKVIRTDVDPGTSARVTQTTYDVDPFGRVTAVKEGTGTQLVHSYAYNTHGRVDRYTDPANRLQKFLGDGLGRVVEHVRVGDSSAFIRNWSTFEDSGATDGRTKVSRFDDLGNVTITHLDYAARPFIVQNPGGDTAPTSLVKNQSMCLYAEYDTASRLSSVYDGDGGETKFWRDGQGRVIQRELVKAGAKHALYNTKDVISRDPVGRITKTNMWGSVTVTSGVPAHDLAIAVETFTEDSIGRTHAETYKFEFAPNNIPSVATTFSGGDPFRTDLDYADGLATGHPTLTAPVGMEFGHDAIGRLEVIDWDKAPGSSSMNSLADYTWVGGLRRSREVRYSSSTNPQLDTMYGYDQYDRLVLIQDDLTPSGGGSATTVSKFEYDYDAASNLLKEKYAKVDGSAGDRFAYDAYHRLTHAWMGVTSTVMAASSNPSGFNGSQMQAELLYGLDGANNRTTSSVQTGALPHVSQYTTQDGTHAQGPSNRYDTVGATTLPPTYEYDERGNLRWDGLYLYVYDYLNRLQMVLRVVSDEGTMMSLTQGGGGETETRYQIIDPGALDDALEEIKSIPNLLRRLPREHTDPTFRDRLKARIRGGVVPLSVGSGGGGGMLPKFVEGADLELYATYAYDAFNRRIMRAVVDDVIGETTFHTYDDWRENAEYGMRFVSSQWIAVPKKQFVWGARLDELIAYRWKNGSGNWETFYVAHGGQDTAVKLVNDGGTVVEQYEYQPYGQVTVYDGSGNLLGNGTASFKGLPFLWKGTRHDVETNLCYVRNRYLLSGLGRFLTDDPMGVWGDSINAGNALVYCSNNPLVYSDPFGLQGETQQAHGGVGGAIAATAIASRAASVAAPSIVAGSAAAGPAVMAAGGVPGMFVILHFHMEAFRRGLGPMPGPRPPAPQPPWVSPPEPPAPPPPDPVIPPIVPEPMPSEPTLRPEPEPSRSSPRPPSHELCEDQYNREYEDCEAMRNSHARSRCHDTILKRYRKCMQDANKMFPDFRYDCFRACGTCVVNAQ